jgi:hypothetical protein
MKRPSRELVGAVAVLLLATGVAVVTVGSLVAGGTESRGRLVAPFAVGEIWAVCGDGPELELAPDCDGGSRKTGAVALRAPGPGVVAAVVEGVCVDLDGGGSIRLAPIEPGVALGERLAMGAPIGSVVGDRVRFSAWGGAGCSGDPVPFADAHGTRILCADDAPTVLVACPVGMLGAVDLQGACDAQYPAERRVAVALESSAYSWVCESPSGGRGDIEVSAECLRLHGLDARAVATDPGDPYSWVCER